MTKSTVFIVDDNPAFLDSLSVLLVSLGMKTRCFQSAEQYLESFDPSIPGCLILDVRLPGITGLELHERLSQLPLCPPVIFLTGNAESPIEFRAVQQGAFEILHKTENEGILRDAIQRAIAKDLDNRRIESRNS